MNRTQLGDLIRRPQVGALIASVAASFALIQSWMGIASSISTIEVARAGFVAPLLIAAVIIANLFPIHVQNHTKLLVASVPLYLMAVLLPPPLAALSAGAGMLIDELRGRVQRDSLLSDIVIITSRWVIVVSIGAWVAHLPLVGVPYAVMLFCAALAMFIGDLLTNSLQIAMWSNEPLFQILRTSAREAGPSEGVQYLLGILGALVAQQHSWAIVLLIVPCAVVYLAFKNLKEMRNGTQLLLESMADAVDLRDTYTGGHSRRVAGYSADILRQLQLIGPEVELIVAAARVHDIGKIGVPDHILNKPDRLTDEERAIMESHAERGAALLARYPDFARGVAIVLHHHEGWDGSGYPHKLAGYAIPFGARVIAVADSYDAMTSDRPYRRGMPIAKASQILREGRGKQWDAAIADAMLQSIAEHLEQPALSSSERAASQAPVRVVPNL